MIHTKGAKTKKELETIGWTFTTTGGGRIFATLVKEGKHVQTLDAMTMSTLRIYCTYPPVIKDLS